MAVMDTQMKCKLAGVSSTHTSLVPGSPTLGMPCRAAKQFSACTFPMKLPYLFSPLLLQYRYAYETARQINEALLSCQSLKLDTTNYCMF